MKNSDEILGRALSGGLKQMSGGGECPSLEKIAALVDGNLEGEPRDALLGHIAVCSHCRKVFTMTHDLVQHDAGDDIDVIGQDECAAPASGRKRLYYLSSVAALAAVAVLALSITIRKPSPEQEKIAATKPSSRPASTSPGEPVANAPASAPKITARSERPGEVKRPEEVVQLLTKDEASQQEAKSFGFVGDNLPKDGPEINVVLPETDREVKSPFKLSVHFVPKQGSKVDLATLRVECLKLINIDLTPRVLPYTTAEGILIEKTNIPTGNHKIRLTVADTMGRVTVQIIIIHVIS
jgi:hypothetical protein